MAFLVATTSLPAVYRLNDDRWNAARSCQKCCKQVGTDLCQAQQKLEAGYFEAKICYLNHQNLT